MMPNQLSNTGQGKAESFNDTVHRQNMLLHMHSLQNDFFNKNVSDKTELNNKYYYKILPLCEHILTT